MMEADALKTTIVPQDARHAWLTQATHVLDNAGLVALPTETVYGLAGDATNPEAVAAIFSAKGRPSHNPLIAHINSLAMAADYVVLNEKAERLAKAFWPGPLTMVLPLKPGAHLAPAVMAKSASLAVRWPKGALGDLVNAFGKPLAAPSANRSGHVSPTLARHVLDDLGGRIAMIVDGGACSMGLESTIVDLRDEIPVLLRPGPLEQETLETCLGQVVSKPATLAPSQPVSPGLLASHYAPKARVRLNILPSQVQKDEAYLGFAHNAIKGQPNLSSSGDLAEASAKLYALLRALDTPKTTSIAVAPIPTDGMGLALQDRLSRAASPRS